MSLLMMAFKRSAALRAWRVCTGARARGHPALHFFSGGKGPEGLAGLPAWSGFAPIPPGSARRRLQGGHGPGPQEEGEAGRRGNNVVGCFADCQLRSRIILSTPLGLTAAGPARQGKSPPYLVLERKGKGYPRMPAALGHRPAAAGPHAGPAPTPAGRGRCRAAPRAAAASQVNLVMCSQPPAFSWPEGDGSRCF
ncbi:uncharacterized protein LOC144576849 [Callithrix jacchus]